MPDQVMVRLLYKLENSFYKGLTKPCITLQGLLIVFRCNIFYFISVDFAQ